MSTKKKRKSTASPAKKSAAAKKAARSRKAVKASKEWDKRYGEPAPRISIVFNKKTIVKGEFGPAVTIGAVEKAMKRRKTVAEPVCIGVTAEGKVLINPTVHDYAVHTGRRS